MHIMLFTFLMLQCECQQGFYEHTAADDVRTRTHSPRLLASLLCRRPQQQTGTLQRNVFHVTLPLGHWSVINADWDISQLSMQTYCFE